MTNKENNFAKDINVPSKEQIIIDGLNVLDTIDEWVNTVVNDRCTAEEAEIEYSNAEVIQNYILDINKQLARKTQEFEQLQEKYEALKLENEEGYEIVDELKQECEELKKANQHIDTNRQCKGSKLKRIEDLISACETGYTDEFIQKIYGIIQEPEPTINDSSIIDRYRKALEEIEKIVSKNYYDDTWADISIKLDDILNIINNAKGEG